MDDANPLVLARVGGTAIRPGVSRNGRLYTRDLIARMVGRAQERLADPDGMPLTMLTHHAAEDDSKLIVGRITSLAMEKDGSVAFDAEMANTPHAKDILSLIEPDENGNQFLKGVSIRGAWIGPVRRETGPDGQLVEIGDALELDGLDFTKRPGVLGATVDTVNRVAAVDTTAAESVDGRTLIHESVQEALVDTTPIREENTMTSPATAMDTAPAARVPYADNGYSGERRYPLGTVAEAAAAWYAFTQKNVTEQYSPAQIKRARQRITKALETHGITATDGVLAGPVQAVVGESVTEGFFSSDDSGSFRVELTNGPTTVCVSSWYCEPEDLAAIGLAAMNGAVAALTALDPDLDADIDVDGEDEDEGDEPAAPKAAAPKPVPAAKESAPGGDAVTELATATPDAPAASVAGSPDDPTVTDQAADPETVKEPALSAEPTAAGTPAAPSININLTPEQFEVWMATQRPASTAPAESAPAAAPAVAEATPASVAETEDQRINRLAEERAVALIQSRVESGGLPTRKGLVAGTTLAESFEDGGDLEDIPADWPQKPLHKYTDRERAKYITPSIERAVMGARSVFAQPE